MIKSFSATPVQVAIVEDDEEIRANLVHMISRSPAFRLLRSYSNGESALAELPGLEPDVVLMDINLPGMDGVECVRLLKPELPAVRFVMLTIYEDGNRLFKSLMAGASATCSSALRPTSYWPQSRKFTKEARR